MIPRVAHILIAEAMSITPYATLQIVFKSGKKLHVESKLILMIHNCFARLLHGRLVFVDDHEPI